MNPIMFVHIATASVALVAGAAALTVRKGARGHAKTGTIFFASMLAMASTGAVIAVMKPERTTALIGITTCYLVATAWSAARRRDGRPGPLDRAALGLILAVVATQFSVALWAMQTDGKLDILPYQVNLGFGALAALAAALDVNFLWRGQLSGVQRIGRHLWRMSAAMLIATTSFFLGQQDEFPQSWQGPWWNLPPLAVLAAMIFWIFRVRFSRAFRHWPPRRAVVTPEREPSSLPAA